MTRSRIMTILMIIIAGEWTSLQHKGGSILAMASIRKFIFEIRNTISTCKVPLWVKQKHTQIQSKIPCKIATNDTVVNTHRDLFPGKCPKVWACPICVTGGRWLVGTWPQKLWGTPLPHDAISHLHINNLFSEPAPDLMWLATSYIAMLPSGDGGATILMWLVIRADQRAIMMQIWGHILLATP